MSTTSNNHNDDACSLPKLLSALALGARSVGGLPLGDEFSFQSSFPEFDALCKSNHAELLEVLSVALQDDAVLQVSTTDTQDPVVWEKCADACDALVENVEAFLSKSLKKKSPSSTSIAQPVQAYAQSARQKAAGSYSRIMAGLVEMEKPQVTYNIKPQNDRTKPFVPNITEKPFAKVPLNLELQPGHGFYERMGELKKGVSSNNNLYASDPNSLVAPTLHVEHVYKEEIQSLEYQQWQLKAPTAKPPPIEKETAPLQATWVDTVQELEKLSRQLQNVQTVAIDLEAHSHHSFAGMTCLMQLSFCVLHKDGQEQQQQQNYLIDTLKLWHSIQKYLAPMFANPSIVKIMHGADSDVQWLQRDFGMYIVNLFDTGRASRLLKLPSAGYAYLLKKYVGIDADKSFQLSDWRQRPLPNEERQYAIMDTYYLLKIYPHLLYDLEHHTSPQVSIRAVLETSQQVCLIRYDKEPFQPLGYKSLMGGGRQNKRTRTDLTERQVRVLKELYDWRDATARATDESLHAVCPNQGLLRLALKCPTSVAALQTCINPLPPLVLQHCTTVLNIVKQAAASVVESTTSRRRPPSTAFFKPLAGGEEHQRAAAARASSTGMSPVLGTEALYKQAGWMTPQNNSLEVVALAATCETTTTTTTTTTDEEEKGDSNAKPRHLLAVNAANKNYNASRPTEHSLNNHSGGKRADGLGAARAVAKKECAEAPLLNKESERAQQSAARIRSSHADNLLVGVGDTIEKGGGGGSDEEQEEGQEEKVDNDDFEIPKSMSEIYKISNRNRRKNKKTSPPRTAVSGTVTHSKPMEVDTLEGAQAVLAKANGGKGYFSTDSKRQRKGNDTEKDKTRPDDMAFMEQIGWIKNRQEAEAMVTDRRREEEVDTVEAPKEKPPAPQAPPPAFDYSSIGSIGVFQPNAPQALNPFFAGAAVAGGSLGLSRGAPDRKKTSNNSSSNATKDKATRSNKQERHEKKDGRSFAYRGKR